MKLSKGETLLEAIERHRRRASELRADVARVQISTVPERLCQGAHAPGGRAALRGAARHWLRGLSR